MTIYRTDQGKLSKSETTKQPGSAKRVHAIFSTENRLRCFNTSYSILTAGLIVSFIFRYYGVI